MNNTHKKRLLLILLVWYLTSQLIFLPWLLSYFFEENTIISELFATLLSISLPTVLLLLKKNNDGSLLFDISFKSNHSIGWREFILMFLGAVSIFGFLFYSQNAIQLMDIFTKGDYSSVLVYPKVNLVSFLISVLTYAIVPAIFEEILFRGIYADAFSADKKWVLFLISTLSFSSMHALGMGTISAAAFGLFLMFCYYKYRSILCCAFLHFFYNLFGLISTNAISLPFSALSVLKDYANNEQIKAAIIFSIGILGLCLFGFFLCFLGISDKKDITEVVSVKTVSSKRNLAYNTVFIVLALGTVILILITTYYW